jgi:hypothetical protein
MYSKTGLFLESRHTFSGGIFGKIEHFGKVVSHAEEPKRPQKKLGPFGAKQRATFLALFQKRAKSVALLGQTCHSLGPFCIFLHSWPWAKNVIGPFVGLYFCLKYV